MTDQVVDAETARQLHAEAVSTRIMAAWVIMVGGPGHRRKFVARLVTTEPTPYLLVANSVVELRDALPRGLDYSDRTPADPKSVVEIWFTPEGGG